MYFWERRIGCWWWVHSKELFIFDFPSAEENKI
jgi:hypothetical protein